MSPSSIAFVIAAALGLAAYWQGRLVGPAIAALALGLILGGR